jgi:hypothetical protein
LSLLCFRRIRFREGRRSRSEATQNPQRAAQQASRRGTGRGSKRGGLRSARRQLWFNLVWLRLAVAILGLVERAPGSKSGTRRLFRQRRSPLIPPLLRTMGSHTDLFEWGPLALRESRSEAGAGATVSLKGAQADIKPTDRGGACTGNGRGGVRCHRERGA